MCMCVCVGGGKEDLRGKQTETKRVRMLNRKTIDNRCDGANV